MCVRGGWLGLGAFVVATVGTLGVATTPAHAATGVEVCTQIDRAAQSFNGRIAYAVVDLGGDATCARGLNDEFLSASLYKLFVLAAAYQEREHGTLSFNEPLVIRNDQLSDDPAELRTERTHDLTVGEALRLMAQVSDNPSAAALRERIGPDIVAAVPIRLGLQHTHLGDEFTTSAGDMARVFQLLHDGKVVSPEASREMLEVLRGEFFRVGLASGMPEDAPFAHKVGALAGFAHDAGLVTTSHGDYAIAVLTEAPSDRGEVFVPTLRADNGVASIAALESDARYIYDLEPAYEVMQRIAQLSYAAYGGAPASTNASEPGGASSVLSSFLGGWRPRELSAAQRITSTWIMALLAVVAAWQIASRERRPERTLAAAVRAAMGMPLASVEEPVAGAVQVEEPELAVAAPVEDAPRSEYDLEPLSEYLEPVSEYDAIPLAPVVAESEAEPELEAVPAAIIVWPGPRRSHRSGIRGIEHITQVVPYTARATTQIMVPAPATRRNPPMRFGSRNNHEEERMEQRGVEPRQEMRPSRPAPPDAQCAAPGDLGPPAPHR